MAGASLRSPAGGIQRLEVALLRCCLVKDRRYPRWTLQRNVSKRCTLPGPAGQTCPSRCRQATGRNMHIQPSLVWASAWSRPLPWLRTAGRNIGASAGAVAAAATAAVAAPSVPGKMEVLGKKKLIMQRPEVKHIGERHLGDKPGEGLVNWDDQMSEGSNWLSVSFELLQPASSRVSAPSVDANSAKSSLCPMDSQSSRRWRPDPPCNFMLALKLPETGRTQPAEVYVHPSLTVGRFRHRVTDAIEDGDRTLSCSVQGVRTLDGLAVADDALLRELLFRGFLFYVRVTRIRGVLSKSPCPAKWRSAVVTADAQASASLHRGTEKACTGGSCCQGQAASRGVLVESLRPSPLSCRQTLAYRVSPLSLTKLMGPLTQGTGCETTAEAANCSLLRPSEVLALFMPCPDSITQAVVTAARGYLLHSQGRRKPYAARCSKAECSADRERQETASEGEACSVPPSSGQQYQGRHKGLNCSSTLLSARGIPSDYQGECSGNAARVPSERSSEETEAPGRQNETTFDDFEEALAFGILSGKERVARKLALVEQEVSARMRQHEKDHALKGPSFRLYSSGEDGRLTTQFDVEAFNKNAEELARLQEKLQLLRGVYSVYFSDGDARLAPGELPEK
ncbi:hypothetical protein CSUI_002613 [Cystoisospora suis]|uniref:Uncharacterized protein n=1 Tax=Cystoisospora suis TaxID=483139 RepID=A0A2C6L8J4_9APIC|nr:hypothetical protein CSUI_002613 [Cystoisospora suis]